MVCGDVVKRISVRADWSEDRKAAAYQHVLCKKPRCLWETRPHEVRIKLALRAGLGRQYIRNSEGGFAEPGGEMFLPRLEDFPAVRAGRLKKEEISYDKSTYICGPVDTGKSWLMCCLAVEALAEGCRVAMINWSRFKREVRSSYQAGSNRTEEEIFNHYDSVDVLCVDDLGVGLDSQGQETRAAREMLYDLIDQRYWARKPTHITSNLNPQRLGEHYDDRIARRIKELCQVVVLDQKVNSSQIT